MSLSVQCSNCQFENMPGVPACGRCGASLQLAARAIDVHPPRASAAARRLRRWLPLHGSMRRMRDGVYGGATWLFPSLAMQHTGFSLFVRTIVPGWPQMYIGQVRRGRIMLAVYLALLSLAVVFLGTALGSVALGLAVATHASSVIDVLWAAAREWRPRLAYAAVILLALFYGLYLPAGWLIGRVATPLRIAVDAPPFAAGDVVLYNRSAYRTSEPAIGDVVLYRIAPAQMTLRQGREPAQVYALQGDRIDRVLAGPRQQATWESQQLRVDGEPTPWGPLNAQNLTTSLQFAVPDHHYLILPSTDTLAYPNEVISRLSLVPRDEILGRAYLRHQPLWRWWWIR